MKLSLTNAYPYPCPELPEDVFLKVHDASINAITTLNGVKGFEYKHALIVEFESQAAYATAMRLTGWPAWDSEGFMLEASYVLQIGFEGKGALVTAQPYTQCSILAASTAYSGFHIHD